MESGAQLILRERLRQIQQEGWSKEHDDEHTKGELLGAARAYALVAYHQEKFGKIIVTEAPPASWPDNWDNEWWKPSKNPKRNLVKAGALIAAEIDRLIRKEENDAANSKIN